MLKKRLFGLTVLIVGIMMAFFLVGCGDDNLGDPSTPPGGSNGVTKVTINQQTVALLQGSTGHTFTATVEVVGDTPQTVIWSLDGSPKTGTSIVPGTGVLTVASIEGGSFRIKATSTEDSSKYDYAYVNVLTSVNGGTVPAGHEWTAAASYTGGYDLPYTLAAYKIGSAEITYALWYDVYKWATDSARGANRYTFYRSGREGKNGTDGAVPSAAAMYHPVSNISWRDAIIWCNALSEKTGRTPLYYTDAAKTIISRTATNSAAGENDFNYLQYKKPGANGFGLPTEAEWEFAARGGSPSIEASSPWRYIYAGSNTVGDVAWIDTNSGNTSHVIATKAPNSLNIYDMSGNAYEMVQDIDFWSPNYWIIQRGGSWYITEYQARNSQRSDSLNTNDYNNELGFRIVSVE